MSSCEADILLGMLQKASLEYNITVPTRVTVSNTLIYAQLLPFYHLCNIPCVKPEELPEDIVNNLYLLNNIFFEAFEKVFGKYTVLITDIEMIPLMEIMKASACSGRETFIDFCSIFMDNKSSLREEINLNGSHTLLGNILNDKNLKNTVAPLLLKNAMKGGMNRNMTSTTSSSGASSSARPSSNVVAVARRDNSGRNYGALTQLMTPSSELGLVSRVAEESLVSRQAEQTAIIETREQRDLLFSILASPKHQATTRALKYLLATLQHSAITGNVESNTQIKEKVLTLFTPQIEALREKVEMMSSAGNVLSLQGVKAGLETYRTEIEKNFGKRNVLSILPGTVKDAAIDVVLAGVAVASAFAAYATFQGDAPSPYDMSQQPTVEYLHTPIQIRDQQTVHLQQPYQAVYTLNEKVHLKPGVTPTPTPTPTTKASLVSSAASTMPNVPKYDSLPDYFENVHPPYIPETPPQTTWQWATRQQPTPYPTPTPPPNTPSVFQVKNTIYARSDAISAIESGATVVNPRSHMDIVKLCPPGTDFNSVDRKCTVQERIGNYMFDSNGRPINVEDLTQLETCKQKDWLAPVKGAALAGSGALGAVAGYLGGLRASLITTTIPIGLQYAGLLAECAPSLISTVGEGLGDIAESTWRFSSGLMYTGISAVSGSALFYRMASRYDIRSDESNYLSLYTKIQDKIRGHCKQILFDNMKETLEISVGSMIANTSSQDYNVAKYFVDNEIVESKSKIKFLEAHALLQKQIDAIKNNTRAQGILSKNKPTQIAELEDKQKKLVDDFIFNGILPGFLNFWYIQATQLYNQKLRRLNLVSEQSDPFLSMVSVVAKEVATDETILEYAKQITANKDIKLQRIRNAARPLNIDAATLRGLSKSLQFWEQAQRPNTAAVSVLTTTGQQGLLRSDTLVINPIEGSQLGAATNYGSNAAATTVPISSLLRNNRGNATSSSSSSSKKAVAAALLPYSRPPASSPRVSTTTASVPVPVPARTPTLPPVMTTTATRTPSRPSANAPVNANAAGVNQTNNTNANGSANNLTTTTSSSTQQGGRRRKMRKTRKAKKHAKRRNIHTRKH